MATEQKVLFKALQENATVTYFVTEFLCHSTCEWASVPVRMTVVEFLLHHHIDKGELHGCVQHNLAFGFSHN